MLRPPGGLELSQAAGCSVQLAIGATRTTLESAPVTYEEMLDALGAEIAAFAETVRGASPETSVPSCPGWDLGDLVKHAGYSHRWAGHMVRVLSDKVVLFR